MESPPIAFKVKKNLNQCRRHDRFINRRFQPTDVVDTGLPKAVGMSDITLVSIGRPDGTFTIILYPIHGLKPIVTMSAAPTELWSD